MSMQMVQLTSLEKETPVMNKGPQELHEAAPLWRRRTDTFGEERHGIMCIVEEKCTYTSPETLVEGHHSTLIHLVVEHFTEVFQR